MEWKRGVIIGLVAVDVLAVNAGVGYLYYKSQITSIKLQTPGELQINNLLPSSSMVDECGEKCKQYIDTKIAEVAGPSAQPKITLTPSPTEKIVRVVQPTVKPATRIVQYVTIPGSGSSGANTWEDLAGTEFYIDLSDYSGLVEVYFESNMKLFNGNGMAYVQLFDMTHGVGVQGSDVQTNNQADTVVTSGKVTFWAGKNLIRVQAKSLTADTAVYNSGRLKIVTEN